MSDKNPNDHYEGILAEEVRDELKAILEGLTPLSYLPGKVDRIDERLERVESDVKIIKLAVRDQAADQNALLKKVVKRWNKH
jgi:hypothetical protein